MGLKKLYGVIGDPIAHSLSPAMHNEELEKLGIDAYYHPFHVKGKDLPKAIEGMKVLGVEGFNITIPHKTDVMPLLDEVDPLAKRIGAVNTVVSNNGKYIGYNTDGQGFIDAVKEEWEVFPASGRTLIIGAGGAARAIYYTLISSGLTQVDICNRTLSRAEELIGSHQTNADSQALTLKEAESELGRYSLLIQTTSIGMGDSEGMSPIMLQNMQQNCFVADIIYTPWKTAFLEQAAAGGAKIQNGIGMLVHQGALAFEKWTGISPDTDRMKKTVMERLGGITC